MEFCPWRILDDAGGAFALGCTGGGLFQAISGFRNSPSGLKRRLVGSITSIKMNTPVIAGSFAMWGITFSAVDCTLAEIRGKEDPWNDIISGAAAGGIFMARHGLHAMAANAIFGGVFGILVTTISGRYFEAM